MHRRINNLKKLSEGASIQDIIVAYPNLTESSFQAVLAYASEVNCK